jgi:hypothetical protein
MNRDELDHYWAGIGRRIRRMGGALLCTSFLILLGMIVLLFGTCGAMVFRSNFADFTVIFEFAEGTVIESVEKETKPLDSQALHASLSWKSRGCRLLVTNHRGEAGEISVTIRNEGGQRARGRLHVSRVGVFGDGHFGAVRASLSGRWKAALPRREKGELVVPLSVEFPP